MAKRAAASMNDQEVTRLRGPAVAILAAVLLGGCPALSGHRCDDAQACGAEGRCEPLGVCSFPDPACPSGRSYGDEVAGEVAGTCTPFEPRCGTGTVQLDDTFDDGVPGPAFRAYDNNANTVVEVGGQVVITLGGAVGEFAGYESNATYDLRGGSVELEVAQVATLARTFTFLALTDPADHKTSLLHGKVTVEQMSAEVDGNNLATRGYVPTERYWRIREGGGQLTWEVSADRAAWAEIHRAAAPLDLSAVVVEPWAYSENGGGELRLERLTVCGP